MSALLQQTGNILSQSKELLRNPAVSGAVSSFLSWVSNRVFANKKAKQERVALIEQQKADEETIAKLTMQIESEIEDNAELEKELNEKVNELDKLLKKNNVNTSTKTNSVNITGSHNKVYLQDIKNSKITHNSMTHSGSGDNIGGDKIIKE